MSGTRDETAEMSVIGAMISDNTSCDVIRARLTAGDFSKDLGRLYLHFLKMRDGGERFVAKSAPEELHELAVRCADSMRFGSHTPLVLTEVAKVENAARVRKAQSLAFSFYDECASVEFAGEKSALEWFRNWSEQFTSVLTVDSRRAPTDMKAVIGQVLESFTDYQKRKGALLGVTTGFPNIDSATRGMRAGDTWILAARTAVGKTAVMTNLVQAAAQDGARTLVYSYEMLPMILGQRMVYARSRVAGQKVEAGLSTEQDGVAILNAANKLMNLPIVFEERGTVADIRATAVGLKRTQGLDLIVVDHVGLVNSLGKSPTREREVAEISRQLKMLARDLAIPVLILCQLNRQGDRHDEPNLSDLRESGALEQDASVVVMLWADEDNAQELHWKLAKNRHGGTGKGEMRFQREIQRVTEVPQ